MKYAHYDSESRKILGYYSSDVHSHIPEPYIEVSDERWQQALNEPGTTVDEAGGDLASPPQPSPEEALAQKRALARATIDRAAGRARARFVSTGQLIEEEYREAEKAVQEWRATGSPADQVPEEISAWIDAANMTAEDAATDIEQTALAWKQVLTQIRTIRLTGKAAIDNATDDAEFMAVAQPYIDQLSALGPTAT